MTTNEDDSYTKFDDSADFDDFDDDSGGTKAATTMVVVAGGGHFARFSRPSSSARSRCR